MLILLLPPAVMLCLAIATIFIPFSFFLPSMYRQGTIGYWISFLDGLQRVILFTTSEEVCQHVIGGNKTERANTDISLSLEEVGLSLVNDHKGLEVAYIGIPP